MRALTLKLGAWGARYVEGMLFICHWFPDGDMHAVDARNLVTDWTPSVRFLKYQAMNDFFL